jgi:tetratricopeptide (TPR) repeat protein
MATVADALAIAVKHHQAGQLQAAEDIYRQILATEPNQPAALERLGVLAHQRGRYDQAVEYLGEAVKFCATEAAVHNNLGEAYRALGNHSEAVACYRRALELEPDRAEIHNNLGIVLVTQGHFKEATPCFQRAVELKPDFAEAHNNLGAVLQDQGRVAEAIPWHQRALHLRPNFAEAYNNLGNALSRLGHRVEAVACYRSAQRTAELFDAHNNLGTTLHNLGQLPEAIACYEQALRLKPDHPEARLNRSLALLLTGDFRNGWLEYEWRWQQTNVSPQHDSRQPLWDGRSLRGKTILVHAEQGFGDTIQFIRYAGLLRDRGARVLVQGHGRLSPLLVACPGIDAWVGRGQELPTFDVHAPLLSLPGILKTDLENIPANIPYVFAAPSLVEQWQHRLNAVVGYKVGIAWQGSPDYRFDGCRSIPLARFAPLARVPSVRLISLQKGEGTDQLDLTRGLFPIVDYRGELDESAGPFMDTAAIMMNLDLVVTSDSATAHLAGALGVPVWVALPFVPDWRWLLDRDESPWYPTMRLFRQRQLGDWEEVFDRMAAELAALVGRDKS